MNTATEQINELTLGQAYVYDFVCEACGSAGELMLPVTVRDFNCPEGCGARYVQWHPPEAIAALMCVVCPVFAEEA